MASQRGYRVISLGAEPDRVISLGAKPDLVISTGAKRSGEICFPINTHTRFPEADGFSQTETRQ